MVLVLLVGCPQKVLFEGVEHIVEVEQFGGAKEFVYVLRVHRSPLALGTGALRQLVGGGVLARGRYDVGAVADLREEREEKNSSTVSLVRRGSQPEASRKMGRLHLPVDP